MRTCNSYDRESSCSTDQWAWRRRPSRLGDCLGWGRCSLCVESPSSSPCNQPASTCVRGSTTQSKGRTGGDWVNACVREHESRSNAPLFWHAFLFCRSDQLRAASKWVSRCNICFRAANRCSGQPTRFHTSSSVPTSCERSFSTAEHRACDYEVEKG